ncbi:unnamed protein product [Zymoseptoria tritici ST99CH_1A5]|uniref:Phosphatidate phosphatase APP1 catalytic domain-containing protein n=1 Tax=Zymoseptoria tritici ST99CH_1A5 TaxID=1276529 RepID=A0A1Y6LWW5_ZYMTR|nr:unnamed protein product [Zymoseptoria tritici ST99CH_1A5]
MVSISGPFCRLRRSTSNAFGIFQSNKQAKYSPEVPSDLSKEMPDLFERLPRMFPWDKSRPVDPEEHTVWLLDNTAFQTQERSVRVKSLEGLRPRRKAKPTVIDCDGKEVAVRKRDESGWQAEFIACYFVKNSGADVSHVIAAIARMLHIDETDIATRQRIAERVQPFADTVLVKRTLRIDVGGKEQVTLGPSTSNGISTDVVPLHIDPMRTGPMTSTPIDLETDPNIPGRTLYYPPTGYLLLSDIDDTIKTTLTPSPMGIIHSTFITSTPLPIPNMPDLYSSLSTLLSSPPFFYLSASPYPLYPFLRPFLSTHYPPGTILLRDASWQNLGGLIASLTRGVEAYKISQMRKVHSWFPKRKVVCIGDSTQRDVESYCAVARQFPGWVGAVFIRRVVGVEGMDEEEKNSPKRFERAFRGLEEKGVVCKVFDEPEEVRVLVEEMVRRDECRA